MGEDGGNRQVRGGEGRKAEVVIGKGEEKAVKRGKEEARKRDKGTCMGGRAEKRGQRERRGSGRDRKRDGPQDDAGNRVPP